MQAKKTKGFSLIELITVVMLISVLGVVAMGRLSGVEGTNQRAFFDELVSAVRYAQKLAVSTGCSVQVTLATTGYQLHQGSPGCSDTAYTLNVVNPLDRAQAYANSSSDVSISPAQSFVFTSDSQVSGLSGDTDFSVSGHQFRIYASTGLVDVL